MQLCDAAWYPPDGGAPEEQRRENSRWPAKARPLGRGSQMITGTTHTMWWVQVTGDTKQGAQQSENPDPSDVPRWLVVERTAQL